MTKRPTTYQPDSEVEKAFDEGWIQQGSFTVRKYALDFIRAQRHADREALEKVIDDVPVISAPENELPSNNNFMVGQINMKMRIHDALTAIEQLKGKE